MSSGIAVAVFVIGLVLAIMLHEYGHFVTARRFGMRADRFFLGFGPTLWSTQRGETEYGVKLLPLGGFVRIRGMSPTDDRRAPVPDAVFDPEAVADDRRQVADEQDVDVLEVGGIPEPTWQRLRAELARRGTPEDVATRIVRRTQRNVPPDAAPLEGRPVLTEVIATEVSDLGRVGDLHHRLLRGDEDRFFHDRPAWQRATVLAAGALSHFLVAAALLFAGYTLLAQPTAVPVVDEVVPDSAASAAGLQPGDELVSVAGVRSDDFGELREVIQQRPGEPTRLVVERDGRRLTFDATPQPEVDPETGETVGLLGFRPEVRERRLPLGEALYETFVGPGSVTQLTVGTVEAMGRVFGPDGIGSIFAQVAGEEERPIDSAGSLVGVANTAGQGTAIFGVFFLVFTLAAVNIFVGLFNLLPLPPLDGGHLAVLGVEESVNAVRRRRGLAADFTVDPRTIAAIALPVIVFIGVISVALLWLDITNPVVLQ